MTGRHFTKLTGNAIPRITGLDPNRPCFSQSDRLNGLQRGDALFVDIIHSNTAMWRLDPIGDVDFYPNGLVLSIRLANRIYHPFHHQAKHNTTRMLVDFMRPK